MCGESEDVAREGVGYVRPLSKKAACLAAGRDVALLDMKRARWYTTGKV
jgi:hypothetical protein